VTEERGDAPEWLIENIAELSKNARTLHIVHVSFLIFCGFTIVATTGRKIIFDEAVHLPIVNLDVPFSWFVITAPLVAISIYIYFQIYLQALKETVTRLRASYAPVEKGRLYPWIINLIEEREPGLLGVLQGAMVNLSLWWLLPVVLLCFLTFTIRKHSFQLTFFEWLISLVGALLTYYFWRRYARLEAEITPRPKFFDVDERLSKLERPAIEFANTFISHWRALISLGLVLLLQLGLLAFSSEQLRDTTDYFSLDLRNEMLVKERPEHYQTPWVNLGGARLERAKLDGAILRRANLARAHLNQASLQRADLQGADLSETRAQGAALPQAALQGADLRRADLSKANLNCANLSGADFRDADLSEAFLMRADLTGAKNLTAAQLTRAVTLFEANLDPPLAAELCNSKPDVCAPPVTEKNLYMFSDYTTAPINRDTERPAKNIPSEKFKANRAFVASYKKIEIVELSSARYLLQRKIEFTMGIYTKKLYLENEAPPPKLMIVPCLL
jgi:uncharacterized protein YjbI with pentapeptide repeats